MVRTCRAAGDVAAGPRSGGLRDLLRRRLRDLLRRRRKSFGDLRDVAGLSGRLRLTRSKFCALKGRTVEGIGLEEN